MRRKGYDPVLGKIGGPHAGFIRVVADQQQRLFRVQRISDRAQFFCSAGERREAAQYGNVRVAAA